MSLAELDLLRLTEALDLARTSFGLTEPNPRVGCVIGTEAGDVLGRGATQAAGHAHAEVMALRDAQSVGSSVRGATAWVTLEPCAHQGLTPPCCDALVAAGIGRCVVALQDPFPAVAGAGLARMRAAGVVVEHVDDPAIVGAARDINIGFFTRMERGRPWVRVKVAASLDGRTALENGRSQWITGEASRADGHSWRRRASAVMTGIGTVLADDPRLDVRAVTTVNQPLRIVLDSRLRTPSSAALLRVPGKTLVIAAPGNSTAAEGLRAAGAEVWDDWRHNAMPLLSELLVRLANRGINEVHVEAGATLTGALLMAGLADELLVYLAPTILGPGRPFATLPTLAKLPATAGYHWVAYDAVGGDLRVRLRRDDPDQGRGALIRASEGFTLPP